MNSKERTLAMLAGNPVDHLPNMAITMMLAADQIGVPYLNYATDFRLLAAGQLRTAERFGIDHVSVISDPAVEATDCGATAVLYPDQPPAIDESNALLADKTVLLRLKAPDPATGQRMSNRLQGVRLLKERVGADKLVEGWIEGPCAESSDLRGINNLMLDFMDDPDFVNELFEFTVQLGLAFARAEVAAGADIVGIGDAAASLVGPRIYRDYVLPAEKVLVDGIHGMGARVRLHICGNTRRILADMGTLGCDLIDLDYPAPVSEARSNMGPDQVLLGNIDPVRTLRNGTPETVYRAIAACHEQAGPRYVVGAGCEVPRDTPAPNLLALADYARDH